MKDICTDLLPGRSASWRFVFLPLLLATVLPHSAATHEVRPAYLELAQTDEETFGVLWKVPARQDYRLAIDVSFPDDAVAVTEPQGGFAGSAHVSRWVVRVPGGLAGREIRIVGLESTRIDVLVRVQYLSGVTQTVRLLPSAPSFVVEAEPTLWDVSSAYLHLGIEHILLGIDHLLFVLALVLLVVGWRRLVGTITMFTVAHSLTLALATLGVVSVPGPPVEACIALSIVFVAAEVVRGRSGTPGLTARAPWIVSFTFGLLHGLGFAGALSEVGLPQQAIPAALLFFNVGVEIGQLAFVAAVLLARAVLQRLPVPAPSWSWRVLPYAIGSVAVFWVIERTMGFFA